MLLFRASRVEVPNSQGGATEELKLGDGAPNPGSTTTTVFLTGASWSSVLAN